MLQQAVRVESPMTSMTEDALWAANLGALRDAIERDPQDGVERVKTRIRKLDAEISAVANRREIVARSKLGGDGAATSVEIVIDANLHKLNGRMAELRELIRKIKRSGAAAPVRPGGIALWGLPDGLKLSAEDLHNGWALMYGRSEARAVAYQQTIPGGGDMGSSGEMLVAQYFGWNKEMARHRMGTWAVTELVCEGKELSEVAKLRRSFPEVVRLMMQSGLSLYHALYPPIDRRAEQA